ncbi:hypothetical protein [Dokdonella sp.]|uniref:hypothetical protein n=1 Tax=Dokdonella sp. TaxID=2291710 RepID=UPI0031C0BE75|nr:hypothetical protein [Dokdonella sp.]
MGVNEGDVQPLVVGVVSHRNLVPAQVEAIRARVHELFAGLRRSFPQLPLTVVSALAAGGDQLVAEEALASGARLIAPLPFPRAVYALDFRDPQRRAHFESLCDQATTLEPTLADDVPCPGAGGQRRRDWCYARTGVYIASHCHLLLALWDGKVSRLPGGTAQVVAYFLGGRLPQLLERRAAGGSANPLDEDTNRLLCHIVCSRDVAGGDPIAPLRPLQLIWRAGEEVTHGPDAMPQAGRVMFARIAELNLDRARHAGAIEAAARDLPGPAQGLAAHAPIERSFAIADWLALHYQRRVMFSMRAMYSLAALMGIAFVLYGDWSQQYMIFVFLLLFALGVALDRVATRREWHRKYLDYRALAEGLRVQAYWRRAGLSITDDGEFAHDDFLQKQDIDLGWIRNVMRAVGLIAAASGQPGRIDLAAVIQEWVGESGRCGQLHYYEGRFTERLRHHHLTQRIGAFSLWASIAISIFLALFVFALQQEVQAVLVSIMATLSIIAAVREAYAYRKADKELIKQYRFMRHLFSRARDALDRTTDATEQRAILRALGEAALTEHAEWTLMHRERPLDHARI